MVVIRLWKRSDLDFVAGSVRREGWGHLRRDVERCWRFEPEGCFIAEVEGRRVGHVFSVCYGGVGWIGLLIVNPENRGRGIGAVLMKKAVGFLQEKGVETIRLEAVEKAVPLYRRLGFRDEFDSLRLCRRLEPGFYGVSRERLERIGGGVVIRVIREEDLERLAGFDSGYFGVGRLRVLLGFFDDGLEGGCLLAERAGRVLGYVMSRRVQDAFLVGPWVCAGSGVAERLFYAWVYAVCGGGDGEVLVRVGVPAVNRSAVGLMEKLGFSLATQSVRMVWGKLKYQGDVSGVYGIGGAEKG